MKMVGVRYWYYCSSYTNLQLFRYKSTHTHQCLPLNSCLLKYVKNNPRPSSVAQLHAHIITSGATQCVYTCNNLMNSYLSIGLISHAHKLFYEIPNKNIVSWTIFISGFTHRRLFSEALSSFREMLSAGLLPNDITLSTILPAFSHLGLLLLGKAVHAFWLRRFYHHNLILETCFVHLYSRFGCMHLAQTVFDEMPVKNVASWNVLISGYATNAMAAQALRLFNLMRHYVGFVDHFTCMSLLSAVSTLCCPTMSSAVHGLLLKSGFSNEQQVQTGLIKMYTSGNLIGEAHSVFCEMQFTDVVACTLMLEGFTSCRQWSKAVQHFGQMMSRHDMSLDSTALVSILCSCGGSGTLLQGRRVHAFIVKQGFSNDVVVGSALIDMYTTCGDLDSAKWCFDAMDEKDVACWNAMIKAMGANGNGGNAVDLLWRMEALGYKPNESTFISVLSACSHAGMVDVGLHIFCHMTVKWGVVPNTQHYACLVDLLGRSGRLDEAYSMMDIMPMQPHIGVYGALLNACKIYGNTEMGAHIFQQLLKLDLKDAGHFCAALNMYASVGDWRAVEMSNVARLQGLKKDPGYSLTVLNMQESVS
ncbi:hypothetical protein RND81_14G255000 [Saponaria officinalis]|uniref:Pentatricopeptide repeat-containing protein n=1 Tax=Saponaria officinalis TaxID=3572 RepID=A0AAW1GTT9_SAPOF